MIATHAHARGFMHSETHRFHQFDNLRAVIVLLGIPFHAAFFLYAIALLKSGHPFSDNSQIPTYTIHDAFFLLAFYLHTYYMPLFFLLAGFSSHLLHEKKGVAHFVRNRLIRIGLPFVLFMLLMAPFALSPILAMTLQDHQSFLKVIQLKYQDGSLWHYLDNTWSGWFLYDLLCFYVASLLWMMITHRRFKTNKIALFLHEKMQQLLLSRWIYLFVLVLSVAALMLGGNWYDVPHRSFQLSFSLLFYYGLWYFIGWHIWKRRTDLSHLVECPWKKLLVSFLAYIVFLVMYHQFYNAQSVWLHWVTTSTYCISMIFGVFANLGIAYRYLSSHQPILRYFVSASYWIYLTKIPVLFALTPMLVSIAMPVYMQFILATFFCLAITVGSYQLLVRHTWLRFLMG